MLSRIAVRSSPRPLWLAPRRTMLGSSCCHVGNNEPLSKREQLVPQTGASDSHSCQFPKKKSKNQKKKKLGSEVNLFQVS